MSHKARSIWLRAAPAVTNSRILRSSAIHPGAPSDISGEIRERATRFVVESWLSSSPIQPRRSSPIHAAPYRASLRPPAQCLSGVAHIRLSQELLPAAWHLESDRRKPPPIGNDPHGGQLATGTLSLAMFLTALRTPTIATSKRGEARPDISASSFPRLKGVKHRSPARIKTPSSANT